MQTVSVDVAAELAVELKGLKAPERIRLLVDRFGSRLVATTSFGIQSAVMLDMIAENAPQIPVVFIDTGYLFPETYKYADELTKRFNLDLRIYQPQITAARMEAVHGRLWEQGGSGLDEYGRITKIEPMARALKELGADVWISGLRSSQSSTRSNRQMAEPQNDTLKVYPILDWADAQVAAYMHDRDLPRHPLAEQGYVTMGDWHSTKPLDPMGDAEATRFNGEKYECGLHTDFQI